MSRAHWSFALLFVPLACFDDPPDAGAESSEGGSDVSSTDAPTTTSASTSTSATSDPDGSGSSDAESSSGSSGESSTTEAMPCTLSGTWDVVLDDAGASGNGAQGRGVLGTTAGTIYATGNADGHWLVRRSEDHGATWEIVDDVAAPVSGGGAVPGGPARAEDGTMFVIGLVGDDDMNARRVVRRSSDGRSWATVDDFQLEDGYASNGGSMAIATDGRIVTAGMADSSQGGFWLVRASEDGGDSWTTIDQYQHDAGSACLPHDVVAAADGAVIVLGHCFDADMQPTWVIRRLDGGSWTTVDDQGAMGAGFGSFGSANGGWVGTRIYAIGTHNDGPGTEVHWLVRTSDDGVSWSTFDEWVSPSGQGRGAAIHESTTGTLVAIGGDNDGTPMVVTRRSDDDGASWDVIDEYHFESGIYGGPLTASADGDLYTSGIGLAANGGLNHWIVRRMACE